MRVGHDEASPMFLLSLLLEVRRRRGCPKRWLVALETPYTALTYCGNVCMVLDIRLTKMMV